MLPFAPRSSSPRAYRLFNLAYVGTLAGLVCAASLASEWLATHTPAGDLARVGEYSEESYRPTQLQTCFDHDMDIQGTLPAQAYDLVALGDSFSHGGGGGSWQNYVCQAAGLRIFTCDDSLLTSAATALVASAEFRRRPPRWVVLEVVERNLAALTVVKSGKPPVLSAPQAFAPLEARARDVQTHAGTARPSAPDRDLARGFAGLRVRATRLVLGHDDTTVARRALARADLFTNLQSGQLLTLQSDVATPLWDERSSVAPRQALVALQRLIEANGRTKALFMIPPNKLTAYSAYLDPAQPPRRPFDEVVPGSDELHLVPVGRALERAIAAHVADVYQPDDTHWSPVGYRIAAGALVAYMEQQGWLARRPQAPRLRSR